MAIIIIDGERFDVPAEGDWELVETAEIAKLGQEKGEVGATIGIIWLVKHRADPSFTIEAAGRIKLGQFELMEGSDEDPLPESSTRENATTPKSAEPSCSEADGPRGDLPTHAFTT